MQLSGVRPSVRPSARLFHPATARRCCGFAAVGSAARAYRSIAARPAGHGGQQQPRCSTARISKCGECHFVS